MSAFWPWKPPTATHLLLNRHPIPKDGSCLFAAIDFVVSNGARQSSDVVWLRQLCAQQILDDPGQYTSVYLGSSPEEYAAWIQHPLRYGGECEISLLADHFNIQINVVSVESLAVLPYAPRRGREREQECGETFKGQVSYLLYTTTAGGHYDAIVAADGRCLFADDGDTYALHPACRHLATFSQYPIPISPPHRERRNAMAVDVAREEQRRLSDASSSPSSSSSTSAAVAEAGTALGRYLWHYARVSVLLSEAPPATGPAARPAGGDDEWSLDG